MCCPWSRRCVAAEMEAIRYLREHFRGRPDLPTANLTAQLSARESCSLQPSTAARWQFGLANELAQGCEDQPQRHSDRTWDNQGLGPLPGRPLRLCASPTGPGLYCEGIAGSDVGAWLRGSAGAALCGQLVVRVHACHSHCSAACTSTARHVVHCALATPACSPCS